MITDKQNEHLQEVRTLGIAFIDSVVEYCTAYVKERNHVQAHKGEHASLCTKKRLLKQRIRTQKAYYALKERSNPFQAQKLIERGKKRVASYEAQVTEIAQMLSQVDEEHRFHTLLILRARDKKRKAKKAFLAKLHEILKERLEI